MVDERKAAVSGILRVARAPRYGAGHSDFSLTIIAAAFLLSGHRKAAQVDVSQGLALALLALIAVMPEYAVDVTFAWKAGRDSQYAPYAVANMTGANRVLSFSH